MLSIMAQRGTCVNQPNENGASSDVEHDGQVVSETDHVPPLTDSSRHGMQSAIERSVLKGDDVGDVKAVHVNMERSGADQIEAQRVTLDHSGVRSLITESAELINSGALRLNADKAAFDKSSVFLANARETRIEHSKVGLAIAGESTIENAGPIGVFVAGSVEATGDVNGALLVAGKVSAGGDVNVTFTAITAGVLGAAFAATLFGLRRLVKR